MSEDVKTEETVAISEKEMDSINKEIDAVQDKKIEDVKKEVAVDINTMRAELEAIRAKSAEIEKKAEEERLKNEIEAEKLRLKKLEEESVQRRVVPQSSNPVAPQQASVASTPLSNDQAWDAFESIARKGVRVSSTEIKVK